MIVEVSGSMLQCLRVWGLGGFEVLGLVSWGLDVGSRDLGIAGFRGSSGLGHGVLGLRG